MGAGIAQVGDGSKLSSSNLASPQLTRCHYIWLTVTMRGYLLLNLIAPNLKKNAAWPMINNVTKHTGINNPFRGLRHIFFCFITLNLCAGAGKKLPTVVVFF